LPVRSARAEDQAAAGQAQQPQQPQRPAALSGGQTSLVGPAVLLGLVRVFMIPASMIGCITLSSATSALAPLPARMAMRC
jgi:hypothetical protein